MAQKLGKLMCFLWQLTKKLFLCRPSMKLCFHSHNTFSWTEAISVSALMSDWLKNHAHHYWIAHFLANDIAPSRPISEICLIWKKNYSRFDHEMDSQANSMDEEIAIYIEEESAVSAEIKPLECVRTIASKAWACACAVNLRRWKEGMPSENHAFAAHWNWFETADNWLHYGMP